MASSEPSSAYKMSRSRHTRASDTVSSGSSSGLATMSTSSTDNLPCSTSSLASSSDSSTCCSNAPTMTANLTKSIKISNDEQYSTSNSESTLTKESGKSTIQPPTSSNLLFSSSPPSATFMQTTPKRGGSSSTRTISSSSNTTGSNSSSFAQLTYADAAIQTTEPSEIEEGLPSTSITSSCPPISISSSVTPKKLTVPPGLGTLSGNTNFSCGTSCTQIICTPLRTIVSQNRRRYQHDGFNLDLTYITDRIIAMGYPADTREALYRNSMSHIVKFLEHYHPGHYKVFNLRGQYVYDTSKFHNRVVSFEMTDHHPPRLELMAPFCREVHEYLEADSRNVVAVHCKAGKGRTGVMICAYLCYINFYNSPRQNMDYYSIVRTHNNRGVTIPSQRRYVYYFNHLRQRKLNYMPLKVELVGIYIEKPPKLHGAFSKGALKVRVANGDVDVFDSEELWISNDAFEEEEQMHKKFPVMEGNDHYDPNDPKPGNECVSRRCYGWTVPPNKRVFLEGDVRIDIFQKSQIKVLNVHQEKKRYCHMWFNTMFTCPGFSGGQYIHGDEQYPYEGTAMIVKKRLRRKGTTDTSSSTDDLYCSSTKSSAVSFNTQPQNNNVNAGLLSSSVPSSPPIQLSSRSNSGRTHGSVSPLVLNENSSDSTAVAKTITQSSTGQLEKLELTPPSSTQQKRHRLPLKINGIGRKRADRSPLSQDSGKEWTSQDTGLSRFSVSTTLINQCTNSKNKIRSSVDNSEDFVEEFEVDKPPGLESHCPEDSLKVLHPYEKHPPRVDIDEMLKDACKRNLMADLYNARRLSVPKDGAVMPKSTVGRPEASGPWCVMRHEREHVNFYGTLEVDKANKKKELDMGFKIIIVTRCIDEGIPFESQLANQFVRVTRRRQLDKDKVKRDKAHSKKFETSPNLSENKLTTSTQTLPPTNNNEDEEEEMEPNGISGNIMATAPSSLQDQESNGRTASETSMHTIPEYVNPLADARRHDPHLSKYFFRQRVTSQSKHPNVHYHCPLMPVNQSVCTQYGCKRSSGSFTIPKRLKPDPQQEVVKHDQNCYKLIIENEDSCFEEFNEMGSLSEEEENVDFSEEAENSTISKNPTNSGRRKVDFKRGDSEEGYQMDGSTRSSWNTSHSNETVGDSESELSAELQQRSDTMTVPSYAQCRQGNQVAVIGGEDLHWKNRNSCSAREEMIKKLSSVSITSREMMVKIAQGDFHPTDSNWVSSSTSSSCQSLPEGT